LFECHCVWLFYFEGDQSCYFCEGFNVKFSFSTDNDGDDFFLLSLKLRVFGGRV
jgi:hypothetical protein